MLVTQGDLLSHRVMYQSFQNNFPHVYVVSEEKDSVPSDRDTSAGPAHNQEVDAHTTGDDIVSADDITVWIDPLDATQVLPANFDRVFYFLLVKLLRNLLHTIESNNDDYRLEHLIYH